VFNNLGLTVGKKQSKKSDCSDFLPVTYLVGQLGSELHRLHSLGSDQ